MSKYPSFVSPQRVSRHLGTDISLVLEEEDASDEVVQAL